MLNWLKRIWHDVTGTPAFIWHKVISAIEAVYGYIDKWIRTLEHAILHVLSIIETSLADVVKFVTHTFVIFEHWVTNSIKDIYKWADTSLKSLLSDIRSVIKWVTSQLNYLLAKIESGISGVERWVLDNIWKPLVKSITTALNWIEHYGMYAYNLLTHPEALVSLIMSYVWSQWLTLVKKWSIPLMRYFLSGWKGLAGVAISVLEDIISQVL